jgi:tetratricopeptide (TPR) repeat protein
MPSAKHKKPESPSQPSPAEAAVAKKSASSQVPPGKSPTDDYPRLLLALRDAAPGALIFVQLNSPVQRRQLLEKLAADGLKRPFAVADFAKLQPGPSPYGVLRELLEDLKPNVPEILFVDGLEYWLDSDPKLGSALETLNLSREQLTNLGAVVVFLLPAYLIDLIRTHALNLWSWRAHHYSLELSEASIRHDGMLQFLDTGHLIALGDTPEARDRRIRILQRLLNEGLTEDRTLDSLTHSVLLPLARELYDSGRLRGALTALERAKDTLEKTEDSLDKADVLNLRALVLRDLGKFDDAQSLFLKSLAIRERAFGQDHPDVATSLNNLALLYHSQGRLSEAEPLYKKALMIYEKVLGRNHPNAAITLNNLAGLYDDQGRYAEAELLHKQALTVAEQTLGADHPRLAAILNNLASVYQSQGRYSEAELLSKRALAVCEKVLGPDHPDVAWSLNNLASLYYIQGKYTDAESLYRRALAIREKMLGPGHPGVATVLGNYAALLRATNREAEAAQLEARAAAIRAKHAQESSQNISVRE